MNEETLWLWFGYGIAASVILYIPVWMYRLVSRSLNSAASVE